MSQILHLNPTFINRQLISIILVWLFHVTAMIGVSIGYEEWFVSKTPINLSLVFVLLLWSFPDKSFRLGIGILTFFVGGMFLEWLGVQYGLVFGAYEYGSNLGPKILGVPWFIGINWAVLTLISATIAQALVKRKFMRILLGASLMVFLDFFMEFSAPIFDFWVFEDGVAPLKNYIAWFGVSSLFHFIYLSLKLKGEKKFSVHLYVAQLVFFIYFYGFYSL